MNDLLFAFASCVKTPGFTFVCRAHARLGIGANTAIFSVIYAVLLRPLPYPEGDRLAIVTETDCEISRRYRFHFPIMSIGNATTGLRTDRDPTARTFNLSGLQGRAPEQISGAIIDCEFFKAIGLEPSSAASSPPRRIESGSVAGSDQRSVVAEDFCARPHVLGRAVNFGNQPYTTLGLMPPEMFSPRTVEVWFPLMAADRQS